MRSKQNIHPVLAVLVAGCLVFSLVACSGAKPEPSSSVDIEPSSTASVGDEVPPKNTSSHISAGGSEATSSELSPISSESSAVGGTSQPTSSLAPPQITITPSNPPASSAPSPASTTRDSTAQVLVPSADGISVLGNSLVEMDISNVAEGYVMVRYLGSNHNVKLQLTRSGGTTYTYNLSSGGSYETFPLVAGNGSYTLNVYENVSGNQYALASGASFEVTLRSGLLPFLYPNQYVNFSPGSNTVAIGAKLAGTAANDLKVVENVYNYVINNISYDFDKAANATSGYLPNVDTIINSGTGICFDYAAVMATMLRTQRIPTKLVVGYSGSIYHAWISVYIKDIGWINDIIYFDGSTWVRMDPTFASSAKSSSDIMKYIGNGNNYNAMFVY